MLQSVEKLHVLVKKYKKKDAFLSINLVLSLILPILFPLLATFLLYVFAPLPFLICCKSYVKRKKRGGGASL